MWVASDTGGTFTDLVAADGSIAKVPSTPDDPGEAVRRGLAAVGRPGSGDPVAVLAHGTTVATNALLERRGARVALVTTTGFADVIEIARQDRPSLYDPRVDRPEPLVPRHLRVEVGGRLDAHGRELEPVPGDSLARAVEAVVEAGVETVAVCLLHADLDPAHERVVAEALRRRGLDVTASHEISPEPREYERTVTTVVNAYLRPTCRAYLERLADAAPTVLVMTSAGGLVPADEAAGRPAALLLSGPAGGVAAGAAVALANGWPDAITFDMGGTSTDVCLVTGGRPEPAAEREVAGLPIRLPSVDVHTIGAGGGSIARIDPGGALVVGPESAGARPGPACYGHGGTAPTVTDANLVAGHLPPGVELPGIGPLDDAAAAAALEGAGVDAAGVLAVVDANMEQALRTVSVERGVDPRGLALVAFGGAGPLHACRLADALGMPCVIVPARAGVLSAVGILGAPRQADAVVSRPEPLDHRHLLDDVRTASARAIAALAAGAVEVRAGLACRYLGQSHELHVPVAPPDASAGVDADAVAEPSVLGGGWQEAFHAEHARHNGYARRDQPIEVVAVRATASSPSPVDVARLPMVERRSAVGPAVIAEPDCTVWVPPGWRADPGAAGALVLTRT